MCAVGLLAVWLSKLATVGRIHGDSGAYHMPTVHWLVEHAIVPGLGNLYALFALNQSYFLYIGLLDAGPFASRPQVLANGLLLLGLFARAALGWSRLIR